MAKRTDGYYGNKPIKAAEGIQGIKLVAGSMLPSAPPCTECPLRKDSKPGYLGGYTPEMYIEALQSIASIACHCSPGFHKQDINNQRHCRGVSVFRLHTGWLNRVTDTYPLFTGSMSDVRKVYEDDRFFATEREFLEHHKNG